MLSSGLFKDKKTQDMLLHPADYIESSEFFSWERFFTKLLIQLTAGGFLAYEKSSLNPAYLEARQRTVLEAALPKLGLERLQPFESRRKELNLAKTWLRLCFVPEVPDRSPTGTSINWGNVTNCRPILNSLELRRKRIAVLPRQEERSALAPVVLQYFALRDAAKTRRNHFRSSALQNPCAFCLRQLCRIRTNCVAAPRLIEKRLKVPLPLVLLQRLGLRQRGELALERGHLEVLGEQAGEKHQDATEEDEVGRRVKPKDARHPEHQLRERRHHDEQHGKKHPEDGVDDLQCRLP